MLGKPQDISTSLGLLLLRLGIGGYMATHGWGKVQMVQQMLDGNPVPFGDPMGFLSNEHALWGAAAAEFLCALLVAVGFCTRLVTLPVVYAMGVAAFKVHLDDPWMMGAGASKEPALLYMIPFLALFFTGPGRFSLDGLLWTRAPAPTDKPRR